MIIADSVVRRVSKFRDNHLCRISLYRRRKVKRIRMIENLPLPDKLHQTGKEEKAEEEKQDEGKHYSYADCLAISVSIVRYHT